MKKSIPFITLLILLMNCQYDDQLEISKLQTFNNETNAAFRMSNTFPDQIFIPDGFSPEGITIGNGSDFYVGSLMDGAVIKGNLRTGTYATLVPGSAGKLAVGMDFDPRSRYLFVAGGFAGNAYVYDTESGVLVAEYIFEASTPTFTNDVIITKVGAYFTDSFQEKLYCIPLGPGGRLPNPPVFNVIALTGFTSVPGQFNTNGIVANPNGTHLVIANFATGILYEVNPKTGNASEIDLGGSLLPGADGLVLKGKDLFVVQSPTEQIAIVELSDDWSRGMIVGTITDDLFRTPTTADIFGDVIYVVNARFNEIPPFTAGPDDDFDVVGIQLP